MYTPLLKLHQLLVIFSWFTLRLSTVGLSEEKGYEAKNFREYKRYTRVLKPISSPALGFAPYLHPTLGRKRDSLREKVIPRTSLHHGP